MLGAAALIPASLLLVRAATEAAGGRPDNDSCGYRGRQHQPCYLATRGYDMATGPGSPRAGSLAADLGQAPLATGQVSQTLKRNSTTTPSHSRLTLPSNIC